MASLNFPDPRSTQTYTEAGLTWTWNSTLGVWSSEAGSVSGGASVSVGENPPSGASQGDLWWNDSVDSYRLFIYTGTEWVDASPQGQEGSGGGLTEAEGDARYLSALSDDTAAGAITFQGVTTHEAGISVSGGAGNPTADGFFKNESADKLQVYTGGERAAMFGGSLSDNYYAGVSAIGRDMAGEAKNCFGVSGSVNWTNVGSGGQISGHYISMGSVDGAAADVPVTGYRVSSNGSSTFTNGVTYGFYSNFSNNANQGAGNDNFNFYADGNAHNYFGGLTKHANGIDIIGGSNSDINNGFYGRQSDQYQEIILKLGGEVAHRFGRLAPSGRVFGQNINNAAVILNSPTATGVTSLYVSSEAADLTDPIKTVVGVESHISDGATQTGGVTDWWAFKATAINNATEHAAHNTYGFWSDVRPVNGSTSAYNFYSAGTAPNYLGGDLKIASAPTNLIGVNNFDTGIGLSSASGLVAVNRSGGTGSANPCLILRRNNGNSTGGWRAIEMYNHDNSSSGFLKISGATTRTIDSRLGATGVAMADGAADIVKLLQPKVITQNGETFNGFLPADLVGTFAAAVDGEAGATLAIGTYTDAEGVVQTDVEEPEAIPYGATWVQTGTRDLMQGVSRGELIPLLTKALQEALARIEELESNTLQPLYATEADLPSASDHHGKTAHVHATGSLYFAHAGNWVKLQNA